MAKWVSLPIKPGITPKRERYGGSDRYLIKRASRKAIPQVEPESPSVCK
ncbi:hypothetical protein SAMN05444583_10790 [Rhodococcus maanshanensis]|uniref:Uncharacterized protein n=1 Tax=Rhodococcus maanshanensis TaxID=183556 RepID=A0A1H7NMX2_9NOCA|nr:hypothetical protein SAMN05444583_10790 [Rhodococcus maanshanensis]